MVLVAPSILSADFSHLHEELQAIEKAGADWVHIDIMDGHFVPNLTIGPAVIAKIRKSTTLFFDVHLMIDHPEKYIEAFAKAGANLITIHRETCPDALPVIQQIKKAGCHAGVSINPETPVDTIRDLVSHVDLVLIMSVHPGFSGQKFIPESLKKIGQAKTLIEKAKKQIYLQVDGGITNENAQSVIKQGATVLVAGNYIFQSKNYTEAIRLLKKA